MGKVIQIALGKDGDLYALCEDGSIWVGKRRYCGPEDAIEWNRLTLPRDVLGAFEGD